MLYNTYQKSLSSSAAANREMLSNSINWSNEVSLGERVLEWFDRVWNFDLRRVWHFIVVPPSVMAGKRIHHEEMLRERRKNNNGKIDPNANEEFEIDYILATKELFHRLFSEFIGTMLLTTIIGADLLESRLGLIRGQAAALNNGLVILFLIYSLGVVSGAHINPVVTLGFTLRRVFPLTWFPLYVISQFVGSIMAGLLIRALFGGEYAALATNSIDPTTSSPLNGFKWEIWLTFCLVFVVLLTATKSAILGSQAAIAVSSVLAVDSVIGGSQSTASMNPWRTLGPAIINNSPDNRHTLWVFIAGPILGSLVAYVAVGFVQGIYRNRNETSSAYGEPLYDEPDDSDQDVSYNLPS